MKPPSRPWRGLAAALTVGLAAGAVTFGLLRSAEAAPIGAGSYATTRPAGASPPTGCGSISTNPRTYVTANAPGRRGPHQRLVVVAAATSALDCAVLRAAARPPDVVRHARAGGLGVSYTTDGRDLRHRDRRRRVPLPYTQDFTARRRRPELARRQGRRLDRLDRHALLDRRRPHACRPRSATACRSSTPRSPAATRQLTVAGHADRVDQQRHTGSASPSTATTTSRYAPTGATWTVSGTTITLHAGRRGLLLRRACCRPRPARRPPTAPPG